jgi:8-oxo-dGTP pyrophosphatase MutT (NUDIX family)
MAGNEEVISIHGREVVISHEPVRMYDDAGIEVGRGTLNEVVSRGLWCRSVHAWMINPEGELFLHQRSFKVFNNPGKWGESCGGYVDGDMTDDEALISEAQEELGVSLQSRDFRKLGEIRQLETRFDGSVSRQFVSVYLIEKKFSESDFVLDARDVIQGKALHWKTFAEQLKRGEIDFVDHKEEIALVLAELSKHY